MQTIEYGNWNEQARQEMRPGAERVVFATSAKNFLCQVVEVQPGSVGKDHCHPQEQISIILQGACDYYVDGVPYRLTAGSYIIDPPGAMHHSIIVDESQPMIILDVFAPSRPEFVESWNQFKEGLKNQ